jgi:hypothetical protein
VRTRRIAALVVGLIVAVTLVSGCASQSPEAVETPEPAPTADLSAEIQELPDGTRYVVHPDKLQSGGPPPDGIPSIDKPEYVSVTEADAWIQDNELVLALEYDGVTRAYPLQILVWHEIVNDTVNGKPILVTYCPLCGSGIAYERTLDGQAVEFGTSGQLYNSNLVMYDRVYGTLWTQIGGQAIIGELSGRLLTPIDIDTVVWRDWAPVHPDAEVLSQDTGFDRDYGVDPYGSYYEDSFIWFPVEGQDDRIHPKTVIFGIEVNGVFKAYPEDDLIESGEINDTVGGRDILIIRGDDGVVTITDVTAKTQIVKERDFWFAWYAFHPKTELYTK